MLSRLVKISVGVGLIALLFATFGQPAPDIEWQPSRIAVSLRTGGSSQVTATATATSSLSALTVDVTPSLSGLVTVTPAQVASLSPGQQVTFTIVFAVPSGTQERSFGGTVSLRSGPRTLAQPLPLKVDVEPGGGSQTITAKGITLTYPSDLHLDQGALDLGGPIALDNFGGVYAQGGFAPAGGLEINITTVALPTGGVSAAINRELAGVVIESTTPRTVGGENGTQVVYSYDLTPTLFIHDTAVYVAHSGVLYKFFLSFRQGEPRESDFVATFGSILDSVQFVQ